MTKLKQLNPNFPNGDCQRTVFACLLGYERPDLIPNFTEMENSHEEMEKNFVVNVEKWLNENNLTYVEMPIESFKESSFIPSGYCTVIGKSPRGDYKHIVIGEIKLVDNRYELTCIWDTSPFHDGTFLDTVETVGFLSRKIEKIEEEKCKHWNTTPSYEYIRCNDCGSIKTDSGSSWGIAKNKWFNSESEAKFYKNNGYLPK